MPRHTLHHIVIAGLWLTGWLGQGVASAQNVSGDNSEGQTPIVQVQKSSPEFEISLPLLLDEAYLGDIDVLINAEQVNVASDRLISLIAQDLHKDVIDQIRAQSSAGRVQIDQIHIEGLLLSYNPQLLQIELQTGTGARDVRILSMRPENRNRFSDIVEPADFSLFVTPSIGLNYSWDDNGNLGKGLQPLSGRIDVGGRIGGEKGVAFRSRQSFGTGAEQYFKRTETQFLFDRPHHFLRGTAGDLRPLGQGFQYIPSMAGISIERYFNFEPSRVIRPVGNQQFQLERPSTVEVLINGVVQREMTLQVGRYDLTDLPLTQGGNDIELRITDDNGHIETITNSNFFDFDLLREGLMDFSASLGIKSRQGLRGIEYSDSPVFTGFVRRGLTPELTAGVDFQADMYGLNAGGSALWASKLGIFNVEGAATTRKNTGSGLAARLNYGQNGYIDENMTWSLNANAQYMSRNFAPINEETEQTTVRRGIRQSTAALFNINSRISTPKWSVNAFAGYKKGRGTSGDGHNFGIGAGYRVTPDIFLNVLGRHSKSDVRDAQSVMAQISWRIDGNKNLRARHDFQDQETRIRLRKNAGRQLGSFSYALGSNYNHGTQNAEIFGNAFYLGNRFEANMRHDISSEGLTGDTMIQSSRLNLSSSLVFADGSIGLSRPVRDNFAIFSLHESIKDKTVLVNPAEDYVGAKSDFLGPAVDVDISPFNTRISFVDVEDIPLGYNLGDGAYVLHPYQYSGYKLKIGTDASYSVVSKVLNKETGEPITYLGGRLESLDDPDFKPVPAFTNRNGRLAATGLMPGRYRLTLFTKEKSVTEITVAKDGPNVQTLDTIELDIS